MYKLGGIGEGLEEQKMCLLSLAVAVVLGVYMSNGLNIRPCRWHLHFFLG